MADTKSATCVTRARSSELRLSWAPGQHFLQQDIAFAQAFEQRDRVGSQDLAGFLHFGGGGD
jgi:hypothetical protein